VPAALALALYGYHLQAGSEPAEAMVKRVQLETDTGTDGGEGHSKGGEGGEGHSKGGDTGGSGHSKGGEGHSKGGDTGGSGHSKGGEGHSKGGEGGSGHSKGGDTGGGGHSKGGDGHSKGGNPPPKPPAPPERPRTPRTPPGGGGDPGLQPRYACYIEGKRYFVWDRRECLRMRHDDGGEIVVVRKKSRKVRRVVDCAEDAGTVVVRRKKARRVAVDYGYAYEDAGRVVRYVGTSRAAQMQLERRGLAVRGSASGYYAGTAGYGTGTMVGYGNGVMVGGYGNNVTINGNVYVGTMGKKHRKKRRYAVEDCNCN
jgi:hypothetical protein